MKKPLFTMAAAVLACSMLLSACNGGGSSSSSGNSSSASVSSSAGTSSAGGSSSEVLTPPEEENPYDGPKNYKGWTSSMSTWNPHMYTSSKVMNNYGTLVALLAARDGSTTLEYVPHHASELPTSSDGGTTWTIKLRDDIAWDDGTPIDANTYEYSFKMQLDPKLVNKNAVNLFDTCVVKGAKDYFEGKNTWEDVGIKAVDDKTLEVVLEYPATEIDFYTTFCSLNWPVKEDVYEACMNADRTSTSYGTTLETTPSCGMFILTDWVVDASDQFTRNDNDPLVKEGYIKLDTIDRRYVSQNTTRSEMFFKGELDNHSLTGDEYIKYKDDPRAVPAYSPNVWGLFVNSESKNKVMADENLRKALYYAAPREEVAKDVFILYTPAPYIVSNAIMVGDKVYRDIDAAKALTEKFATNAELAKEYFDKAYEANGSQKIVVDQIYFDGQDSMKRLAEVVQEVYENLFGKDRFEMTLRAVVPSAAYDIYRAGDYDLGVGVRLANEFNPWSTMNVWTSTYADKYITGFYSEEFDKLQFDSTYGELVNDPEGRAAALARMEELLLDYVAFIPLMQNDNTVLYAERILLPNDGYLPRIGHASSQCDITDPTI